MWTRRAKLVNGNGCFILAEHVFPEPSQAGRRVPEAEELWKQLALTDKCEWNILIKGNIWKYRLHANHVILKMDEMKNL